MKQTLACLAAGALLSTGPALAAEVNYHNEIRPVFERYCSACHGPASPDYGEFMEHKEKFKGMSRGPRMNSYADLLFYVAWPETGALMRRLDDGRHTKDGKPGNMYANLGATEDERQKNLALIKAWVGENAWVLKRQADITKEELLRIRAAY